MKYKDQLFYKLLTDFLTVHLPRRKNASPHTIQSYKDTLNLFLDFMRDIKNTPAEKVGFDSFSKENIENFFDWMQNTWHCRIATCNLRLAGLRSFLKYAGSVDLTKQYLHAAVSEMPKKRPGDAKVVEYLSPLAMQTLMAQPDSGTPKGIRDLFYTTLLYDTAARDSELLNLCLGDVMKHGSRYSVLLHGKCRKDRILSLEPKTVQHYCRYLELFHPAETRRDDDYLFYTVCHGHRNRMSDDCVGRFIKKYSSMAHTINPEVPEAVHPHQFRHTRAMNLYQNGIQLPELQQILGHASLTTVLIYAHADAGMKRKAIEKVTISNRIVRDLPVEPVYKDDETIRRLCGLRQKKLFRFFEEVMLTIYLKLLD